MATESLRLHFLPGPVSPPGIAIPGNILRALEIDQGERRLWVSLGATRRNVPLLAGSKGDRVLVSPDVARDLCLPLPRTLRTRYIRETGTLHIGPVVAVLGVKRRRAGPRSRRLFGARNVDMRHLMKHGRSLGLLAFVATPEGVLPDRDWVEGYVPSGGRWARRRFPLPDVVYDRVQARSYERRASTRSAKEFLRSHPHIRYFNEGFFDKWAMHQKMEGHPVLAAYLPRTHLLDGAEGLRAFLHKHPRAFLKPTEGSQGKGVMRVHVKHGRYEWRYGSRRGSTSSFESLYRIVNRARRRRTYIIQPDLGLATLGGSPFDIRLLMQKDGTGVWKRTKAYVRLAAKGRFTSNLSRGGTAMGLASVIRARFGRRRKRVLTEIRTAARQIVEALDEVMETPLGEIGLDLGVDGRGRVWIIEVNAKPFRKVRDGGPKRGVRLSFHRPMAYARYLSGL